jgi:hypothetical protein
VRAHSAAIFIGLGDIVGTDRDKAAIANLHLTMEVNQPFGLPAVLGAIPSPAEDQDHGMRTLQFGEFPVFSDVVRKLIVGEDRPWNDIWPHVKSSRSQPILSGIFEVLAVIRKFGSRLSGATQCRAMGLVPSP